MARTSKTNYTANGVYVTPTDFSIGDRVRLSYDGLLSQSGATEVYAHIGYGTQQNWQNVADVKMTKSANGLFEATFPVSPTTTTKTSSSLNLAFKDSAGNWDNNNGSNYTFKVK